MSIKNISAANETAEPEIKVLCQLSRSFGLAVSTTVADLNDNSISVMDRVIFIQFVCDEGEP